MVTITLFKRFIIVSFLVIFFEHGIKCAILINLLITTRIESNDLDIGKTIIKSNDIEVHGANGIGKV